MADASSGTPYRSQNAAVSASVRVDLGHRDPLDRLLALPAAQRGQHGGGQQVGPGQGRRELQGLGHGLHPPRSHGKLPAWGSRVVRVVRVAAAGVGLAALVVALVQSTGTVANFFSFFTVQSNILAVVLLLGGGLADPRSPRWAYFRGAVTLYMVITGIVYAVLLADVDVQLDHRVGQRGPAPDPPAAAAGRLALRPAVAPDPGREGAGLARLPRCCTSPTRSSAGRSRTSTRTRSWIRGRTAMTT